MSQLNILWLAVLWSDIAVAISIAIPVAIAVVSIAATAITIYICQAYMPSMDAEHG